jgi:hypothetical protein
MIMRLGFSVATAIDPEVLIIDEILAVGDLYFQKKCVDRIFDFRKRGKSILFCSHSLYDVRQVCDEVDLDPGRARAHAGPAAGRHAGLRELRALARGRGPRRSAAASRWRAARTCRSSSRCGCCSKTAGPSPDTVQTGADLRFELDFRVRRSGPGVNVGAAIFRTDNVLAATFLSQLAGIATVHEQGAYRCTLRLPDLRLSRASTPSSATSSTSTACTCTTTGRSRRTCS